MLTSASAGADPTESGNGTKDKAALPVAAVVSASGQDSEKEAVIPAGEASGAFLAGWSDSADVNADFMMPTLEEMLGEPVDDLGYFDDLSGLKADMVAYAKRFIGKRYRSGASGPNAFDCSGFTSFVFRNFGMTLNRQSRSQGTQGEAVDVHEAEVGDLIFFRGRRSGKVIGHVGMVVSVDRESGTVDFIHASTSQGIRIDSYPGEPYYTKRFVSIRRILGTDETSMANAD